MLPRVGISYVFYKLSPTSDKLWFAVRDYHNTYIRANEYNSAWHGLNELLEVARFNVLTEPFPVYFSSIRHERHFLTLGCKDIRELPTASHQKIIFVIVEDMTPARQKTIMKLCEGYRATLYITFESIHIKPIEFY